MHQEQSINRCSTGELVELIGTRKSFNDIIEFIMKNDNKIVNQSMYDKLISQEVIKKKDNDPKIYYIKFILMKIF